MRIRIIVSPQLGCLEATVKAIGESCHEDATKAFEQLIKVIAGFLNSFKVEAKEIELDNNLEKALIVKVLKVSCW
jgi:hypothetical protein